MCAGFPTFQQESIVALELHRFNFHTRMKLIWAVGPFHRSLVGTQIKPPQLTAHIPKDEAIRQQPSLQKSFYMHSPFSLPLKKYEKF